MKSSFPAFGDSWFISGLDDIFRSQGPRPRRSRLMLSGFSHLALKWLGGGLVISDRFQFRLVTTFESYFSNLSRTTFGIFRKAI